MINHNNWRLFLLPHASPNLLQNEELTSAHHRGVLETFLELLLLFPLRGKIDPSRLSLPDYDRLRSDEGILKVEILSLYFMVMEPAGRRNVYRILDGERTL